MKFYYRGLACLVGAMVSFSGCASKSVHQEQTGFLSDYETLKSKSVSPDYKVRHYVQEDLHGYNKVWVKDVSVIPSIALAEQTQEQKELYAQIRAYVKKGLNAAIEQESALVLANAAQSDTLELEIAVSAVEVHLGDANWNPFSSTALGLNVMSYGGYMDDAVRVLIESRMSKQGGLVAESMQIIQESPIRIQSDTLRFDDLKPALDLWLKDAADKILQMRKSKKEK